MLTELFLGIATIVLLWYLYDQRKFKGYPPGPKRFPVLGNLPQVALTAASSVSKTPSWIIHELSRVHGDIMHIRMGVVDMIVFSSYDTITELLNRDGVGNRKPMQYYTDRNGEGNLGLIISNDPEWSVIRKFTIRTLREFGFGKSMSMESVIFEEAMKYVDYFKAKTLKTSNSGTIHVEADLFDLTVVNVLWRLVTGKPYELEDERVIQTIRLSNAYVRSLTVDDITVCYPLIGTLFPKLTGRVLRRKLVEELKSFLKEVVLEHDSEDMKEECFIDVFLNEIKQKGGMFTHEQLIYTLLDLFQAGSETTSKTLTFSLLHMMRNPAIQERVYNELIASQENIHDLQDMSRKLPYSYVVLMEVLRFNHVVPISAPYMSYNDVNIRGYTIKAGTALMINVDSIHYDERTWGDPKEFRPERFLDDQGKIKTELVEHVVTFGKGKRACLGQTLAESTLSIYFIVLLKHFKFEVVHGENLPSVIPKPGLTYAPEPFNLRISTR